MSDNSSAEKGALDIVWPESLQLLCGFHVAQAEWQWLNSNAAVDTKKILMKLFQKVRIIFAVGQRTIRVEACSGVRRRQQLLLIHIF